MARRQVNIFINGRAVENSLKAIRSEKGKINRELNQMVVGSEEFNKKLKELDKISDVYTDVQKKMGRIDTGFKKISAGLTKFAGIAGIAFGVNEIIQFGKELFQVSVNMETLRKKAATVFGQALPAVTAAAEDNARAMGFTTQQYIAAATAIGDLLIPMGFTREEAAAQSTEITNLSGALSEWSGGKKTAEEVSASLAKALTGEREELKTLGIVISEEDVKTRLRDKNLQNLTGTYLQQAKAVATLELITERSADAQQAYAENSGSLARRQAELAATFGQIRERLATALLPVFERLLGLAESVTGAIEFFSRGLEKMGGSSQSAAKSVQELQAQFNAEVEALKSGNLSQENRAMLIDRINKKYERYLPNLISETDSIDELTAAQNSANEAFNKRIVLLAAQDQLVETQRKLNEAKAEEVRLAVALEEAEAKDAARGVNAGNSRQRARRGSSNDELGALRKNQELTAELKTEFQEIIEVAKLAGVEIDKVLGGGEESEGDTIADRLGAGAGAGKEVEKNLERLAEIVKKFQQEQSLEALSDSERALEEIRIKYQKQIELALELERQGFTVATGQRIELERLRDEELKALADEQFAAKLATDAERDAEETAASIERQLAREERRKAVQQEIDDQVNAVILEGRELAIIELEAYYEELLLKAEEFNIDTLGIEIARRRELEQINKEYDKKDLDNAKEAAQAQKAVAMARAQAVGTALKSLYSDVLNEQERAAGAGKLLALINIGISSAEAISKATAASAGIPFPGNLAAIGTSVATVLSSIGQARRVLNSTPDVQQRKEGGYVTVRGEDDGQTYSARHIGRPRTGRLPSHPVLIDSITGSPVLASERGAEYFVAHNDLANPAVFRHVHAIENIVRQRAEGGFSTEGNLAPAAAPTSTNSEGGAQMDPALVAQMVAVLADLSSLLRSGKIYTRMDDDTVINFQNRVNELNEASGGVLG